MKGIVRLGSGIVIALLLCTVLISGVQATVYSLIPVISADGRYVVYDSGATGLVSGDINGKQDIFVRDRQKGTTTLVSKSSTGVLGNGDSFSPSISSDDRYVAFYSSATNLVAGDTNAASDIFVRDRQTGTTMLVSKSSAGVQGNGVSFSPVISADGRYVAFYSSATNLVSVAPHGIGNIFVRDRQTGTTTLVSKSSAGVVGNGSNTYDPSLSSDGRYVAFESDSANLVSGDTNDKRDIFVRDRQNGTTTLVSKSSAGVLGDADSYFPSLSSDGRYVAFESGAANLVSGDTNGVSDIFVRDRQTGTTSRVSKSSAGAGGNGASYNPSLTSDGRYVAFESYATNLVSGDTNGVRDIFVRDRQTGSTTRVSRSSSGVESNGASYNPSLTSDGRYVAFESYATNLVAGDVNGYPDVFIRDRHNGTTTLVSKS